MKTSSCTKPFIMALFTSICSNTQPNVSVRIILIVTGLMTGEEVSVHSKSLCLLFHQDIVLF